MKTFHYTMNHRADEAYMAKMCQAGWAAVRLVEGVWTFERCTPGRYTYREAYLRGKSAAEIEQYKQALAARGIEFVSRYSFWAIFRSEQDFQLYTPAEEQDVCLRIRRPMLIGSVLCWLVAAALVWLALAVSAWFWVPGVLLAAYAGMCSCLAVSYTKLLRTLDKKEI